MDDSKVIPLFQPSKARLLLTNNVFLALEHRIDHCPGARFLYVSPDSYLAARAFSCFKSILKVRPIMTIETSDRFTAVFSNGAEVVFLTAPAARSFAGLRPTWTVFEEHSKLGDPGACQPVVGDIFVVDPVDFGIV